MALNFSQDDSRSALATLARGEHETALFARAVTFDLSQARS